MTGLWDAAKFLFFGRKVSTSPLQFWQDLAQINLFLARNRMQQWRNHQQHIRNLYLWCFSNQNNAFAQSMPVFYGALKVTAMIVTAMLNVQFSNDVSHESFVFTSWSCSFEGSLAQDCAKVAAVFFLLLSVFDAFHVLFLSLKEGYLFVFFRLGISFWIPVSLLFSAFLLPCFSISLLFSALLLLCFSAFLLLCFSDLWLFIYTVLIPK